QLDRSRVPVIGLLARYMAGKLLSGHAGKLLRFENQLIGRRAVRGNDSTKRSYIADVADEGARIYVPNGRNLVAVQIKLRGLRRAPVGRNLRELPHHERLDVRPRGFLVFEVRSHISDVRISQTDNLAGVTGVGENFLVSGEAGIENDFAAAARDRASRAAIKNAPVFQRENRRSVLNFRQWVLPSGS